MSIFFHVELRAWPPCNFVSWDMNRERHVCGSRYLYPQISMSQYKDGCPTVVGAKLLLPESLHILCQCHVLFNYTQLINRGCEFNTNSYSLQTQLRPPLTLVTAVCLRVTNTTLTKLSNMCLISRTKWSTSKDTFCQTQRKQSIKCFQLSNA